MGSVPRPVKGKEREERPTGEELVMIEMKVSAGNERRNERGFRSVNMKRRELD